MLFLILSIKLQKMPRKVWVYSPKKARPKISPQIKEEIKNICDEFIESKLKPSYVKEFNPHIKEQQRVDFIVSGISITFILWRYLKTRETM